MESQETHILKEVKGDDKNVCKETLDTTGAQNVNEQDINTLCEQIAVTNIENSENVDKKCNDVSQYAVKDGENVERIKRHRRRRKRMNKPTSVDSNTDKVPLEAIKSNTTDGQENGDGKIRKCNTKKENETSAKGTDPLVKSKQKNIPNLKMSDQDQQVQENLVKTNPRKDSEGLPERNRKYPEKLSNHSRGRERTNSDNRGRGYMRGINRDRGQVFHPNSNRGSMYDGGRGRGGLDFIGGRGIPHFNRGRGRIDFKIGGGRPNFNRGRGRSEFGRGSEIKEFSSGRPYFHRGRGRGSSYEICRGRTSYAQSNREFRGDSYDAKENNFPDRGRRNEEFNRGTAISYNRNVGREKEGEKRSYNRGGSHTADVRNSLVRGGGTRDFNRGRGRQDFQSGRGSGYNRIEEE
jgi:hypothetical protein